MKKQDIIDKFIFGKDKESPTTYLRARFFIVFQFIFFTLNLVSLPYYFTLEYINLLPEIKITYVLLVLLFASVFFIYPKYGYRITFVNVHSFFASFVSMYTTYYFSGGIFSPDHIFAPAISIYAFLVANRITGIVWTVIGLFQIVFFYFFQIFQGYFLRS